MKSVVKTIAGVLISGVFLYLALHNVKWHEMLEALVGVRLSWLIASVVVYFLSMVVRSLRWSILLHPVKRINPVRLFPSVIIGYATNNILPLRMGEFVRAYVSGVREGVSRSASFATIIIERIFDGLTMIAILLATMALFSKSASTSWRFLDYTLIITSIIFIGALAFFFALIFFEKKTKNLIDWLSRLLPNKIEDLVNHILQRFLSGLTVLRSGGNLVLVALLSLAAWSCEGIMYFFTAQAMGLEGLGLGKNLMVLAVVNLVIMIPAAPGFVGTFEFSCKKTMALFGVTASTAAGYAIVLHAAQYLPITLLGIYYLARYNISLKEASIQDK